MYPPADQAPYPAQPKKHRNWGAWVVVGCVALGAPIAIAGLTESEGQQGQSPAVTVQATETITPTTTVTETSTPATATSTTTSRTTTSRVPTSEPSATVPPTTTPRTTQRPAPRTTTTRPPVRTSAPPPAPRTTEEATVTYKNCAAVQAAGKAPIRRGQPGYASHLDRDGDGVGCAGD